MTFQITVKPSGRQFFCDAGETILHAALRAGINLPYGCKNGACSSCRGIILEGSVQHAAHQERALSAADKANGFALFCCARPDTDIVIESREVPGMGDFPVKKLPARIIKMEQKSSDVMILSLQLPASEPLRYHAGQYIDILLKDGKRRSYSLANAPHDNASITLHIRHMPGGLFTDQVFGTLKERDILRLEGPQGSFFLREETQSPIIFLASGTGFAPIKAMVEYMQHTRNERPVLLYWGGRRPHDLYMHHLCEEWMRIMPHVRYVPVISNAQPEDNWQGRTGLVHQAVMEDISDMSGYQVYACGTPAMVEAAQQDFSTLCGLPHDTFYADAFTSEADVSSRT